MKKNKIHIIIISFLMIGFTSCDIIEGPYYTNSNNNNIDTSLVIKKILLEDFTGHRCSNCPSASEEIDALKNIYGDQVISIAIHPHSNFSIPNPINSNDYTYDFRTSFGEDLDDLFLMVDAGLPVGMINRVGFNNSNHQLGKDEWALATDIELNKDPVFDIIIESSVINGIGNVNIQVESLSNLNQEYKIVICLVENNILEWQTDENGNIEDYVHNHVLRCMINSTWGESIGSNFINGDSWEKNYSINITDLENYNESYSLNNLFMGNGNCKGWNENNMKVVAYIYNSSNYEIVQAEQNPLTNY
tara:strand:- start:17229 stop:18140 length:912 start_codon:yes stop_codon:yes gene_type:complete